MKWIVPRAALDQRMWMNWYERSQKSKCQTLLRGYLPFFTFCMIDIFSQTACRWFWQAWRGEPSCGLMLWTILTSVGPRHTKIFKNPKQDGNGMSLDVIHLDTATRCKVFACIVCPTHLLKLVGGLLDLPQASQKVQQHQAMMWCESKHVTVKVWKTETEGNTFLIPHEVSPRLELFCFSNEARALDLMIKPSWWIKITQIVANQPMVPESLTARTRALCGWLLVWTTWARQRAFEALRCSIGSEMDWIFVWYWYKLQFMNVYNIVFLTNQHKSI